MTPKERKEKLDKRVALSTAIKFNNLSPEQKTALENQIIEEKKAFAEAIKAERTSQYKQNEQVETIEKFNKKGRKK